jgi:DNA-binding MarR family transcriptional regulator
MMDRTLRDGRVVAACVVWGAELERAANTAARRLSAGLNFRDLLLLAVVFDHAESVLPSQLIGPVYTTAPGVSGSLRRLEQAGLVTRGVGSDARTRPVRLTAAAGEMAAAIRAPWAAFVDAQLDRLDDAQRAELYRLLVKGSGRWDDFWAQSDEGD